MAGGLAPGAVHSLCGAVQRRSRTGRHSNSNEQSVLLSCSTWCTVSCCTGLNGLLLTSTVAVYCCATHLSAPPCRALYHCNYCHKDISDNVRIKCADCPDFDLCVECFSVGVETNAHSNSHSYRVMDNLSFPIFHPSWGVSDCCCCCCCSGCIVRTRSAAALALDATLAAPAIAAAVPADGAAAVASAAVATPVGVASALAVAAVAA